MKAPLLFENAWTEAEKFCFDRIAEMTGLQGGVDLFLGPRPDAVNCANFQFVRPKKGGAMIFDGSNLFPFSATLDFWFLTRPRIQELIMRVARDLPDLNLKKSNVQQWAFDATDGVSAITKTSIYVKAQDKTLDTSTARLSFVVVFFAGSRGKG